jgi:hypothetical protein
MLDQILKTKLAALRPPARPSTRQAAAVRTGAARTGFGAVLAETRQSAEPRQSTAPASEPPTPSSSDHPAPGLDTRVAEAATRYADLLGRVGRGSLDASQAVGRLMRDGVDGSLAQQLIADARRAAPATVPAGPTLLELSEIQDTGLKTAIAQINNDDRLTAPEKTVGVRALQVAGTEKEIARALQDNAAALAVPLALERISASDAVAEVMSRSNVSRAAAEEAVRRLGGTV